MRKINPSSPLWDSTSYLYINNTAVFNNQAGAVFNVVNNGGYVFYGSAGTFNNAGTLNLTGGYLYVGHFIQTAAGTTTFVLNGTTTGTQYPQIYASVDVNLNGSTVVTLGGSYDPAFGTFYTLVNTTTRTGKFSSLTLPGLDPGLAWYSGYTTTGLTLKVFRALFIPFVAR